MSRLGGSLALPIVRRQACGERCVALVLLLLCGVLAVEAQVPGGSGPRRVSITEQTLRWGQTVGLCRSLALSPEGERLVWLDWRGRLSCVDEEGRFHWSRPVRNLARIVTGPGAELTAGYWPASRLHRRVVLFGPGGAARFALECDGPVESVAVSNDGRRVAVGTRAGSLYIVTRAGEYFRSRRLAAAGAVVQLFFGRSNVLYFVTGAPAGLGRIAADGTQEWYHSAGPQVEYLVSATPEGTALAVAEREQSSRRSGMLSLWSARGDRVWSRVLPGWPTIVRASHGAGRIVVGFEREVTVGQMTRSERSLACFDAEGNQVWRKGGAFLEDPLFVAMHDGGEWVVSLDREYRFYLLGDQGDTRWRRSARSPLQIAVSSADGTNIAVAFANGRLAWLHIPHPPR